MNSKRIRRVRAIGVIIAIVFFALSVGLTETNANQLVNHWDGTNGSFTVEQNEEHLTIIVLTEVSSGNCPEFRFEYMDDEEKTPLPVEKKDCSEWYADDVWQYRIGTLESDRYTFTASDDVSIVAVNGDVDEYLENRALGNGLTDVGSCFCCLSFVIPFILGRVSSRTMDPAHEIQFNDSFVMPTPFQEVPEPSEEESVEETPATEPTVESEEEQHEGVFWGGLGDQ